ncbi:RNA polymerase beta subunit rpoC2b (apicoplast) [Theileria orientalis]|uniref:RNA polymerase beta subunit rpoC2b n=1 Tax=Theileria orientalis TaxID=68886 RepID=A0A976SI64_THEOR|nr:RNA polymerase beta subunit rpoC2b [Theileria orientalis]
MKILTDYLHTLTYNNIEKIKNICKFDNKHENIYYLNELYNSVFNVNKFKHFTEHDFNLNNNKPKTSDISVIDKIFEGGVDKTSENNFYDNIKIVSYIKISDEGCYVYGMNNCKLNKIKCIFNTNFYNLSLILFPLTFNDYLENSIYVFNIYKYIYCKSFNSYKSCFIALFYYYFGLLASLICLYRGHNIKILNSNIIIIICKLSSFVKIIGGVYSNYFSGSVINFKLINIINNSLYLCNERICLYKPYLIGITKYVLSDSGIFSKLSFQETLKFFKNIIFEHNIDWTVDSKSNIISSSFIPVGSGWYRYFFNK